jgi:hypothetical protein
VTPRKATNSASQSWDQFWGEVSKGRTEVIRGVEIKVPTDMPLILEQRVQELQDSSDMNDVAELLSILFGTDCIEQWREAGMGLQEFQTVLTWGIAHANGSDLSFAEAYDLVKNGDGEGKAMAPPTPNRAVRRAQSTGGGGRSKRTSSASTASARARSRS